MTREEAAALKSIFIADKRDPPPVDRRRMMQRLVALRSKPAAQ